MAEFGCSCSHLSCKQHVGDHLAGNPGHATSSILLPLSEEETSILQATTEAEFLSLINQEISNRNAAIEKLLREIKKVEETYSMKVESLFEIQEEILSVFKEVGKRS